MLKRKIENELLKWKRDKNKSPLLVRGCRQCGKTSSIIKFAKENYTNVIYINFFEKPEYKLIFENALDVDTIIGKMTSLFSFALANDYENTIIILDEIQVCGNARTSLKFFKIDGRFDVIASGSLLGVKGVGEDITSIPVGYETNIYMYPMDFEEFLWANGVSDKVINDLKNNFNDVTIVDEAVQYKMWNLLLSYIVVGGMPHVVDEYVKTKNYNNVIKIQKDIISDYRDDIVKYASKNDKIKILECFDSVPAQLSKENKKFQYSLIKKGARFRDYEHCIEWLIDAGIVVKCKNLHMIELPLDGNADNDCFKIYMQDIGLLIAMFEEGTQFDILNNKLYTYKGAIYENIAADILSKTGRKLYYFKKDSGLEIDFVVRYKNDCIPIEIKATNGYAKSLSTVVKNKEIYHIEYGFKFGKYNVGKENNIYTLPLYMLFLLNEN